MTAQVIQFPQPRPERPERPERTKIYPPGTSPTTAALPRPAPGQAYRQEYSEFDPQSALISADRCCVTGKRVALGAAALAATFIGGCYVLGSAIAAAISGRAQ